MLIFTFFGRMILFGFLTLCVLQDIRRMEIERRLFLLMGIAVCLYELRLLLSGTLPPYRELLLSVIPGLVLLLVSKLSREALGLGDSLFFLLLGPCCGAVRLLSILAASFLLAAVCALFFITAASMRGGVQRGRRIPFLPFTIAPVLYHIFTLSAPTERKLYLAVICSLIVLYIFQAVLILQKAKQKPRLFRLPERSPGQTARKLRGSLTVEASYIFSLIFLAVSAMIRFSWKQRNACLAAFLLTETSVRAAHAEPLYDPHGADEADLSAELRLRLSSIQALKDSALHVERSPLHSRALLQNSEMKLSAERRNANSEDVMRAATAIREYSNPLQKQKGSSDHATDLK